MRQPYHRQLLDYLGLVAGMFDELGMGHVIDQATEHNPETRIVAAGHAGKAMVLNGMGFVNPLVLDLIVEYQAGIPPLMKPLSRNTSDAIDFGHVITQHMAKLHTTEGTVYLVADRALYSEENLHKLASMQSQWITRGPPTLIDAQAALAQRWVLISSEHRLPQAQHTVDRSLLKQSAATVKAFRRAPCYVC